MNDSVKLCIYFCGKDLHFYEKPQESLLKLFLFTIQNDFVDNDCSMHCDAHPSVTLADVYPHVSRVMSAVSLHQTHSSFVLP